MAPAPRPLLCWPCGTQGHPQPTQPATSPSEPGAELWQQKCSFWRKTTRMIFYFPLIQLLYPALPEECLSTLCPAVSSLHGPSCNVSRHPLHLNDPIPHGLAPALPRGCHMSPCHATCCQPTHTQPPSYSPPSLNGSNGSVVPLSQLPSSLPSESSD